MTEGTAPPFVFQIFDSPNLSPPALSDGHVVQYTADRAGRGWESQMFGRRKRVLSLLSLIYILWVSPLSLCNHCCSAGTKAPDLHTAICSSGEAVSLLLQASQTLGHHRHLAPGKQGHLRHLAPGTGGISDTWHQVNRGITDTWHQVNRGISDTWHQVQGASQTPGTR